IRCPTAAHGAIVKRGHVQLHALALERHVARITFDTRRPPRSHYLEPEPVAIELPGAAGIADVDDGNRVLKHNNHAKLKFSEVFHVDRKLRKQIKSDPFARELGHTVSWVEEHKEPLIRYGGIALAVVVVGLGIYFFMRHQSNVRAEALNHALAVDTA